MTERRFTDLATVQGSRLTNDGYLIAEAFVARAGIQFYRGSEVGLVDRDVVRVWRPESEVKDAASVRTYTHAPITLGHPDVMVDAANWKDMAKGEVSTEAEWKDGKLRLPLIVKDAEAIAAIQGGTRELSAGYTCALDFTDGVTPEGEAYDAVQRNIRINHLAIVPRGRAGSECRIGDADTWGAAPITPNGKDTAMADANLTTVVLGDKAVSVAVSDAPAIEAFKATTAKTIADMAAKAKEDDDEAEKKVAAKDAELAKKDAQIADLTGKVLDAAALDKLVADRADLVARAKSLDVNVVTDGKSAAEIKRAVVESKLGDAAKGKSEAYLDAAFDLLGDGKADPLKDALGKTVTTAVADLDKVYDEQRATLQDAWKNPIGRKEA